MVIEHAIEEIDIVSTSSVLIASLNRSLANLSKSFCVVSSSAFILNGDLVGSC